MLLLVLSGCDEAQTTGPSLTTTGSALSYQWDGHGSLTLTGTAEGEGEMTVSLTIEDGRVVPTITAGAGGATFEGLVMTGPWEVAGEESAVLWRQGYQSWSWSGVSVMTEPTLAFG